MAEKARELAGLLGRRFRMIDVQASPRYAADHGMFFPGMIVIDDFKMVYPGQAEQLLESYRRKGPIPGEQSYLPLPPGEPDEIVPLTPDRVREAAAVCLPTDDVPGRRHKEEWLSSEAASLLGDLGGMIARKGGRAVGVIEVVRADRIPYPISQVRTPISEAGPSELFITCLYGLGGEPLDYRGALLAALEEWALGNGYAGITAVTGMETPYPNGPWPLFMAAGYELGPYLGRALLRHRWEDNHMVRRELRQTKEREVSLELV